MDPTFAQQFGIAVQSDILGQAAKDRQRRGARSFGQEERPAGRALRLVAWPWRRGRTHLMVDHSSGQDPPAQDKPANSRPCGLEGHRYRHVP